MCVFIVTLPADTDHRGRALWNGSGDVAHFPKSYVQSHTDTLQPYTLHTIHLEHYSVTVRFVSGAADGDDTKNC